MRLASATLLLEAGGDARICGHCREGSDKFNKAIAGERGVVRMTRAIGLGVGGRSHEKHLVRTGVAMHGDFSDGVYARSAADDHERILLVRRIRARLPSQRSDS